jgi:hypothetical protein
LVNQAAISALLVVVLQPPNDVFDPARFLDALVGGSVALAVNYLFPINPERLVERTARPVFDELSAVLEEIAAALRDGDREGVERTLVRARTIDDERVTNFYEALAAGHETARLSPTRRRALQHLELYANAGTRIDLAVINTRVLARGAANALRRGDGVPSLLPEAVQDLARAVRALATFLEEARGPDETRRFALEAARKATEILKERHDLAISVLVGQIRSAAPPPCRRWRRRRGAPRRSAKGAHTPRPGSRKASASISTSISGAMRRRTSTMLVAGRISPKNSPWARPISSQSSMLTA